VAGEAADGQTALQLVTEIDVDVVVMDVNLPGMNGIEATRQMRRVSPRIIIIGLSTHDTATMAETMREAGAVAYLSKGGSVDSLLMTIRQSKQRLWGS